ncbi:hypothetical protein [Marinobacter sp. LV10R510-11A]|uniref:hypothetical protein n=1 Tax=Marinobacter sp. LV10R510-11A TaxID=1415568 RepID=UPI0029DE525A|nr:hypothetical protein [Marinobacter sp. LV10R510-11A]
MKLSAESRRYLLEVREDRHGRRSTTVSSQLPIEEKYNVIGDANSDGYHSGSPASQRLQVQSQG